jgi:hypothetical protein
MGTFAASLVVFGLAFLGLALGVLLGRSPISGSCGGLSRIPGVEKQCGCDNPCPRRLREMQRARESGEGSRT